MTETITGPAREQRLRCVVPAGHPALDGHFPGHPLAPGVLLLDWVLGAVLGAVPGAVLHAGLPARLALQALPSVKFLRALEPGEAFEIVWQRQGLDVRFSCETADGAAVQGRMVLREDRA